jgi:hypothetical protein
LATPPSRWLICEATAIGVNLQKAIVMFARIPDWARKDEELKGNHDGTACSDFGEGEIWSLSEERPILKFGNDSPTKWLMYGWTWLSDFLVSKTDGLELLRFVRVRRWPRQKFDMFSNGEKFGEISQLNPLYTRYKAELRNGTIWEFVLPLFLSAWYFGTSSDGGRIVVRCFTHYNWGTLIDTQHDSPFLLAILGFLHREHLRHG